MKLFRFRVPAVFSLLTLILSASTTEQVVASHAAGGEITWTCLSNGQYRFKLRFYRDCNGIPAPVNISLSTTVPGVPSIALTRIAINDLSAQGLDPSGSTSCPNCLNPQGNIGIIQENVYESAPVTLNGVPSPAGWQFYWGECCRNFSLNNLVNPGSTGFRTRAVMYPYAGQNSNPCFDSSPHFVEKPSLVFCTGVPVSFSAVVLDSERDSIVYSWGQPLTDGGANVSFSPGYNINSQLPSAYHNPSNIGPFLDPVSGNITFTSFTAGNFSVTIKATAYKLGIMVAEVFREVNVTIKNNCPLVNGVVNTSPTISAPFMDPGTGLYTLFADTVYAGDTVQFSIDVNDLQTFNNGLPQSVIVEAFSEQFGLNFTDPDTGCVFPPCATLSQAFPTSYNPYMVDSTQLSQTINFTWVTTLAHSRPTSGLPQGFMEPHLFHFKAYDNFCSAIGLNNATVSVVVLSNGVDGIVYTDYDGSCTRQTFEPGVAGLNLEINPGGYIVTTNNDGYWFLSDSLANGTYTVSIDTMGSPYNFSCSVVQTFVIYDGVGSTQYFGVESNITPCTDPQVTLAFPFARRCMANTINVSACNGANANAMLLNAYSDVELDTLFSFISASVPHTIIGPNKYRFQLGDLFPGQCENFQISAFLNCNATLGQAVCAEAELFPVDTCVYDTIPGPGNCTFPWDHSSIDVNGYCMNDSVYFVVRNDGNPGSGDMVCFSETRLLLDGVYTLQDSVKLNGGDSILFVYAATGATMRLEVDQHPLHPGNSQPNATVELCGDSSLMITGLLNAFPLNDSDPFVDVHCMEVTAAVDPNDKTGYPTGITANHYIFPNRQLQYLIRFQNTGNDTAFTVVIRDTLDPNLNIFTVSPGVSSHNYSFKLHGQRELEWRFNNIMLPDSNVNEPASHGFVTFTVEQVPNLPDFTEILNSAAIYFDFSAPVITNQTLHTINRSQFPTDIVEVAANESTMLLYPNPTGDSFNIQFFKEGSDQAQIVEVYGMDGRMLKRFHCEDAGETSFSTTGLSSATYLIRVVFNNGESIYNPLIIQR